MIAQKPGPCVGPHQTCNGRIQVGDSIRSYLPPGRQRKGWAHYSCLSNTPTPVPDHTTPVPDHTIRTYSSYLAFIDKACSGGWATSRETSRPDWFGTATFEDAKTLAYSGWHEKVHTVQALSDSTLTNVRQHTKEVFRTFNDVSGSEVDVGKYLSGEPECMIEYLPQQIAKPGRVITILVSGTFSSGISAMDIIKRGATICALIEILERLQHSTELYWENSVSSHYAKYKYTTLVKLKSASDTLDFAQTVFAICHPSMLRRMMFSVKEQETPEIREEFSFNGGSYGYPAGLTQTSAINATIALDTMHLGVSPKDWIIDQLTQFGLIGD